MNKTIIVTVRNKVATANKTVYVCGNDDFVIDFDFDQEWDEFPVKTARFIHNGTHTDVVVNGNRCNVPKIKNTHGIKVGVYAGDLRTTTPAHVFAAKSILCGSSVPDAPSEDVYNQIMEAVNDIAKKADEMTGGAEEIYIGDGDMPDGCKLQITVNENHSGSFVDLGSITSAPVVGRIDGNVIKLSGDLPAGTYEIKYVLADGSTVDIATYEVVG